jgi:SUN domain-containing protein 1/2
VYVGVVPDVWFDSLDCLITWPFVNNILNSLFSAWLLADNNQRNQFLSYLPLTATTTTTASTLFSLPLTTLSSVKQYLPDWNAKFPDLDLNLNWLRMPARPEWFTSSTGSAPASSQYIKLDDSVKGALGADEYAKLLAHIELYIDRVAADKMQQQHHHQRVESERLQQQANSRHTDDIAAHITQQVKNSFAVYKYELTDSDCDRIAAKVRAQIEIYVDDKFKLLASEQSEVRPFVFSDDNIREIQKVINQSFETKNYQLKVEAAAGGDGDAVNWEGVLAKVLKSSQLSAFVDGKLTVIVKANEEKLARLSGLIEELRAEVKGLKAAESVSGQADLVAGMHTLQAKQENLANEFAELRAAQDKKLELILNEMNLKLAKNSEQQFLRLDEKVRSIVLEILGYELGEEGVAGDLDIKNWIKSVFVAREYLELRLNQVNNQSDHRVQDEMQKSAAVIMQEVSNKIKREVLTVVDVKQKESAKTVNLHGGLGEDEVRRIVREALAVYDADKTGLVDYALESAGGQVLSTRCTESYQAKSAQISVFGIPLWYPSNTPRTAITPAVQPGQCWAFQGFPGFLGKYLK